MVNHSYPMARPVGADGRQTRQAILDAALELFAEKGYFGTSLREIAAVVGVRESALYNYFNSKDALFLALLARDRETVTEQLSQFLAQPRTDVRSFLERLSARILDHFCEPREERLFLVLMSDGMRLAKEGHIDLVERMTTCAALFHDVMRQIIADGWVRPGRPEMLAVEFMGPLLLWRNLHAINPNDPLVINRDAFVRDHVNHFLAGAERHTTGRARSDKPASRHPRVKSRRSPRRTVTS